jgi:hypothetical protein
MVGMFSLKNSSFLLLALGVPPSIATRNSPNQGEVTTNDHSPACEVFHSRAELRPSPSIIVSFPKTEKRSCVLQRSSGCFPILLVDWSSIQDDDTSYFLQRLFAGSPMFQKFQSSFLKSIDNFS